MEARALEELYHQRRDFDDDNDNDEDDALSEYTYHARHFAKWFNSCL